MPKPNPKHPKAWVLTQNQDYTPTGVLQLGQVLTNFMDPNSAILASGTVPIPDKTLRDQSIHRGTTPLPSPTRPVFGRGSRSLTGPPDPPVLI